VLFGRSRTTAGARGLLLVFAGKPLGEGPHGPPTMADRILIGLGQLGHRETVGAVVRQEGGVIAKTAVTAR
jgi:hypothetical protein